MGNLTSEKLELTGENHVEAWLKENGYENIVRAEAAPAEREIRATGTLGDMLIQVRTFLHPNRPFRLSEYESHKLALRAARIKNSASAAYVVVNEEGELVGEITWERLG